MRLRDQILEFVNSLDGNYSFNGNSQSDRDRFHGFSDPYTFLYTVSTLSLIGSDALVINLLNELKGKLPIDQIKVSGLKAHTINYIELHSLPMLWALEAKYYKDLTYSPQKWLSTDETMDEILHFSLIESWRDSNILLGLCANLVRNFQIFNESYDAQAARNYLTEYWNAQDGLLEGQVKISNLNSICGTFHLIPFYRYHRFNLPYPVQLADTILDFECPSGYSSLPGGFVCLDLDILIIIDYLLAHDLPPQKRDGLIRFSSNLRRVIMENQNPDFGWSDEFYGLERNALKLIRFLFRIYARTNCRNTTLWSAKKIVRRRFFRSRYRYANSVLANGAKFDESNIFATWFRLISLKNNLDLDGNIPDFPSLGY